MSSPDLHPEELIDRAARGALSASERQTLDQHLAACAVCRFELSARADFAAAPVPSLDVDSLVTRALSGAASAPTRRRARPGALVAAAVALLGVSSFAAVWTGALPRLVEAIIGPSAPAPARPRQVLPRAPAEPPPAAVAPTPEPVEPQPEPSAPPRVAPKTVVARASVAPAPVLPAPAPPLPTAAELFAQANDARIAGSPWDARRLYAALLAEYPSSPEAWLTRATYGRMLLDSGDAGAADEQLTAYLSGPDSALREEALAAHADALRLLGRTADEAVAWRVLLRDYPDSLHATRAHARLREMK